MARYADPTGAHRPIAPGIVGARPTAKTGSMIVLACVLLGGLLGVGIRARRNTEAAALAQRSEVRTAAVVTEPSSPPVLPVAASAGPTAPAPSAAKAAPKKPAPVRSSGGRRSPATKVAAPAKEKKGRAGRDRIALAHDDRSREAREKTVRPSKKTSSLDAESVLKAAMGATENTL